MGVASLLRMSMMRQSFEVRMREPNERTQITKSIRNVLRRKLMRKRIWS